MTAARKLRLFSRLDRYVAAHFVGSYGAAMGLMMGLFLILDLAGNVDDWFEPWSDGSTVSSWVIAKYCLLNLPYQFLQVAPFITLIAGMFTVNRMLKKNEISAILSAGVSVHRMLVPVSLGGVVIAAGMFGRRAMIQRGIAEDGAGEVGGPHGGAVQHGAA